MANTKTILRGSLALGLGLFDRTKQKTKQVINDIAGDISPEERKKAVDNLFESIDKNKEEFKDSVMTHINSVAKELEKATRPKTKSAKPA